MFESVNFKLLINKDTIKSIIPIFNSLKDNIYHFYNDGFLDYFLSTLEKKQFIKTLLHRQPTNFYDIFYPTKLTKIKDKYDREEVISTDSIESIFLENSKITIIGDAGSGKSTLINHIFFLSFLNSYKAPILVPLRDLNIELSNLEFFIRDKILNAKLTPSDTFLNKLLNDGNFLFLLDGYDEIKSSDKQTITNNLANFIDKYSNNSFILTSRPNSNIEYFKDFFNYKIRDLDEYDIEKFVKLQIKDKKLALTIINSIKESPNQYINDFLKNSLLLTLYIITYNRYSILPDKKYIFYRRVFDVLYSEHDSITKIGFERERESKLNQEEIEEILEIFSFITLFSSKYNFEKDYIFKILNDIKDKKNLEFSNNSLIKELIVAINIWVEDSGIYSFAHKSLQEYFAVNYINKLNSENKRRVFKKIVERVFIDKFDLNNFLSIYYEIDKLNFLKFYSLVALENFKTMLIDENGDVKYDVVLVFEGISIRYKGYWLGSNEYLEFYRNTSIIPQKANLYFFLRKYLESEFQQPKKIISQEGYQSFFLNDYDLIYFIKTITKEFQEYLEKTGIQEEIIKTIEYIDEFKLDIENTIKTLEESENSFVDLLE